MLGGIYWKNGTLSGALTGLSAGFLLWLYMLYYFYRGMRCVYGQRRRQTLLKYSAILGLYIVMGGITFAVTALYSALTL